MASLWRDRVGRFWNTSYNSKEEECETYQPTHIHTHTHTEDKQKLEMIIPRTMTTVGLSFLHSSALEDNCGNMSVCGSGRRCTRTCSTLCLRRLSTQSLPLLFIFRLFRLWQDIKEFAFTWLHVLVLNIFPINL